jgi:hypothetical protein
LNRPDWHSHFGARYVLVRPDRHVAWRGDETPLDVGAVLDKACGVTRATGWGGRASNQVNPVVRIAEPYQTRQGL